MATVIAGTAEMFVMVNRGTENSKNTVEPLGPTLVRQIGLATSLGIVASHNAAPK
jgi:hypothetical protein